MFQCRQRFPLFVLMVFVIQMVWNNKIGAQSLSFYKSEKVVVSSRWMKNIPSADLPQILQYPKLGTAQISEAGGGFVLRYDNQGIAEYDTIVFQAGGEIHAYALKNKFVVTADDYHMGTSDSSFLVDVLVNDVSYSDLQLTDVAFSEGVSAWIENQKIRVDAADPGLYYVYYTACDASQNCDEAKLTLLIPDPRKNRDTIVLKDVLEQKLVLPLPDDSYRLVRSGPENIFTEDASFEVHFFRQDFGENEIVFQSGDGKTLVYQIDFVNKWRKNGLNSRDRIFMQPGNSVTVDLTENDLWKNIYAVETDHPDLTINTSGGGVVRIEAGNDFEGRTKFSYVTCAFPRCDTTEVVVYVDHFQPAKEVFDIEVDASEPSVIPFYTPVRNYTFSILDQPKNGQLSLTADGRGFVFTPASGSKGESVARIRYTHPLPKGNVFRSEHQLRFSVSDIAGRTDCEDCVWPGDTDQNGVVDLGDLENIGRFIGEKGGTRRAGDHWRAQSGTPWLSFEDSELHHFDADGDGLISEHDVLTILKNYGKEHGIYANPVVAKNIPVEIVSSQGEIELGEEVVLEFLVGDDDHILTDVNGFSAEIEVDGGMLEKEQVEVIKDQSTWLKSYQPTLALKASSGDNQIAVGEFRVRSIGVDGRGTALKIRIIVEDEIEGFRTSRAKSRKAVRIIIKNMTLHAGEDKVRLPDQILELPVKEEDQPVTEEDRVRIFPVPAGDHVNIRWNPDTAVRSVTLYNPSGMLIRDYDVTPGEDRMKIDTGGMPDGVYILQLKGKDKTVVRKMSVMK